MDYSQAVVGHLAPHHETYCCPGTKPTIADAGMDLEYSKDESLLYSKDGVVCTLQNHHRHPHRHRPYHRTTFQAFPYQDFLHHCYFCTLL